MVAVQKVSVSLPTDILDEVRMAVASDDYVNIDHVVHDALLWWQESNKTPEERLAWLKQAIEDGLNSGPPIAVDPDTFFEEIKRRGREQLARRKKAA